ncbi:paramyosin [Scaptodrosophila lebanonensis]|uniref:Paramyosin n=1 Tax=Drosophila lebanonensis TaxID=7225 RepID=A0A6J2U741_DROLE|nr:paramyosin [Scaptodrosophila lebanonensis]XP_030382994.1 paramyosin [Scaptodrosophila lebanonensis]
MGLQHKIVFLFFSLIGLSLWETAAASLVTNEEIRGTIQSLIYSYNQLDNKLERHEHRERVLGELMKKAMQSLQKGQKSLEPLNGIFARLDDRVSQIETMLLKQEDKYNGQADSVNQAVDHIFKWMRENDDCLKHPPNAGAPAASNAPTSNEFVEQQQEINRQLLNEIKQLSANVAKLLDTSKATSEQTQQSIERLPKADQLLTQIDEKLQKHASAVVAAAATASPAAPDNSLFEGELMTRLDTLSKGVEEIRIAKSQMPAPAAGLTETDKIYIQELNNDTINALVALKSEAKDAQQTALTKVTERLQQTEANIQADVKQLSQEVANSVGVLNKFSGELSTNFSKLGDGFKVLDNFNTVMLTNSDELLNTQRKVEFGTIQVVQKITLHLEQEFANLSSLLASRFEGLNQSIVDTQTEVGRNLNTSLDQVWHYIEIMSSDISDSAELLRNMQTGHEGYINSTSHSMLALSDKVEQTKKHMIDMDSNLNYLLGKLSLMSSEFKNIKDGLATALEDLRKSFRDLHERMPTGPGPHNIEKNQYHTETDVSLLSKRAIEGPKP